MIERELGNLLRSSLHDMQVDLAIHAANHKAAAVILPVVVVTRIVEVPIDDFFCTFTHKLTNKLQTYQSNWYSNASANQETQ